EFRLRDGRRPMMRGSLAALEAELGTADFLRTHRSWLVNARAVTGLKPEGSGDYSVSLDGLEAPLSRRYPEALKRLRMGAS
ncbi:MAG: LytTR family DNA-binding domain-containing protein, partial [Phenylobacterium sp.]|nr:LytTR family DNA-binding domain-containing protein [Phenylobacterium sp.]